MKYKLLVLCFVTIMLLFVLFVFWYVPSDASLRFQLQDVQKSYETSQGRERKQQKEYDDAAAAIPETEAEIAGIKPKSEAAQQEVTELKEQRKQNMTKSLRLILLLVTAFALLFMVLSLLNYIHMKNNLADLTDQLALSRQTWEKIAEEKVELQGILKTKKEELKEVELSLSEATERAKTLRNEIEILQQEIEVLQLLKSLVNTPCITWW